MLRYENWTNISLMALTGLFYIINPIQAWEQTSSHTQNEMLLQAPEILKIIANLTDNGQAEAAAPFYRYFDCLLVDEWVIAHSNRVIQKLQEQGLQVIATTDPTRIPNENELVIVYGNYHHSHNNLPYTNKIWRHPLYFNQIKHDVCEYHKSWESVGIIYILNLKERADRYQEILAELCRLQAPLDRIYHYQAQVERPTNDPNIDPIAGATKNHLDVVSHFLSTEHEHCLILEDDITFTADIQGCLERLGLFFERDYDYDVCLLAASKYHDIKPYDDLLLLSYQVCTTSSAYLLNNKTAHKALFYFQDGYNKLLTTKNPYYCCDRYWAEMQKDNRFFLFQTKFGYQRCNYSSITKQTACHFD